MYHALTLFFVLQLIQFWLLEAEHGYQQRDNVERERDPDRDSVHVESAIKM